MKSKLLTIEEANRMLPLLRKIVFDIQTSWEMIIAKRTELECLEKAVKQNPALLEELNSKLAGPSARIQELKAELNYLIEKINNYIREVEDLGCFVEEFKRGIINFPSLFHGRKIFLCWGLGEDHVDHWHELDESYNDRLRIHDTDQFLTEKQKTSRGT
jgi:hypothetical protein